MSSSSSSSSSSPTSEIECSEFDIEMQDPVWTQPRKDVIRLQQICFKIATAIKLVESSQPKELIFVPEEVMDPTMDTNKLSRHQERGSFLQRFFSPRNALQFSFSALRLGHLWKTAKEVQSQLQLLVVPMSANLELDSLISFTQLKLTAFEEKYHTNLTFVDNYAAETIKYMALIDMSADALEKNEIWKKLFSENKYWAKSFLEKNPPRSQWIKDRTNENETLQKRAEDSRIVWNQAKRANSAGQFDRVLALITSHGNLSPTESCDIMNEFEMLRIALTSIEAECRERIEVSKMVENDKIKRKQVAAELIESKKPTYALMQQQSTQRMNIQNELLRVAGLAAIAVLVIIILGFALTHTQQQGSITIDDIKKLIQVNNLPNAHNHDEN